LGSRSGVLSRIKANIKRGKGGKKILAWVQVLLRDPCVYCGKYGADTIDHIVPKAKWVQIESEVGVKHWSNFAPAHKKCNFDRGTKPVFWGGLK
jgi:5-methylcytosine-specific restriction endonuclease McrA